MDDKKVKKQKDDEKLEEKVDDEEVVDEKEEKKDIEEGIGEKAADEAADLAAKVVALEDQLKRSVADYRNLENRSRDERIEFVKYANKSLIEQLLPAFDTLFLAAKYTEDESVKLTAKHALDVLAGVGVVRVETTGKKYDPKTMEAIEVVTGAEGEVIEETQPGFTLNGRIIRPARVKVGGKEKGE